MTTITSKSIIGRDGRWYTLIRTAMGWRLKARTDHGGDMHYAGGVRWTRRGAWFGAPEEALAGVGPETAAILMQSVRDRERR